MSKRMIVLLLLFGFAIAKQYYTEQFTCGPSGTAQCSNVGVGKDGTPMCAGSLCPKTFSYTGPSNTNVYPFKFLKLTRQENLGGTVEQCTQSTPIDGEGISWTGPVTLSTCYRYVRTPRNYYTEQYTCGSSGTTLCSNVGQKLGGGNPMCGGLLCPATFSYTGNGIYFKGERYTRRVTFGGNVAQCTQNSINLEGEPLNWIGNITPDLCFQYMISPINYYSEQYTCGPSGNSLCANVGLTTVIATIPMCAGSYCPKTFTYTGPSGYFFKGQKLARQENGATEQCTSYITPIDNQAIIWEGTVNASTCYKYVPTTSPTPPSKFYSEQYTCGPTGTSMCSSPGRGMMTGNPMCAGTNCPVTFTYVGSTPFAFQGQKRTRQQLSDNKQCQYTVPIDQNTMSWYSSLFTSTCYQYI